MCAHSVVPILLLLSTGQNDVLLGINYDFPLVVLYLPLLAMLPKTHLYEFLDRL